MGLRTVPLPAQSVGKIAVYRALLVVGVVVFLTGVFSLYRSGDLPEASRNWSLDYGLNWIAAQRLVDREPIYDRAAARAEGVRLIRPDMRLTSRGPFSSYI